MGKIIDQMYESVQESEEIQNGREGSQKMIESIVEKLMGKHDMKKEELSDLLYGLELTAEKEGFRSGVIMGAQLMKKLRF